MHEIQTKMNQDGRSTFSTAPPPPPQIRHWFKKLSQTKATILCYSAVFYLRQRSWGKVIFSQASVILLTGAVYSRAGFAPRGPPRGGVCSGGVSAPGVGVSALGVSALGVSVLGGVCSGGGGCLLRGWGVSGLGGVCFWGVSGLQWYLVQGCLVLGGCLVETPPGTATALGGTHPTGMHSCS